MKQIKNNFKLKTLLIILVLLFTSGFLSSCSVFKENDRDGKKLLGQQREVKIYFTKKSKKSGGLVLVPVRRGILKQESIIDGSLRELFLGPTHEEVFKGIMTEIPVGTRLINAENAEDEVLANISSQFVTGGGSATMQVRYLQIYKTLKNICPGKKIFLNVEGKPLKTIGGEGLEVKQPLGKINDYTKEEYKEDARKP